MSLAVPPALAVRCVNTIRTLAADTVQKANSGHPGAPMGCAPIAFLLWSQIMKYNPKNPHWINRDRFVLSNGHACALQYVMLHLSGYDVSLDDLKSFRQLGSKTPGHPENTHTPGVEVATGPLGQGISNAVGFAIAQSHLAATFNVPDLPPIIDNYTFVICGDGCLQEGISSEASSLAGHLGLGKLIVLYDDNHITIDGDTDLSFTEDVLARYAGYGWHTQYVADGDNDFEGLLAAVEAAKAVSDRPSIIKVKTTIGFGSKKQGTEAVHGAPLGAEDVALVNAKLGFDPAVTFAVPEEVSAFFAGIAAKGAAAEAEWAANFAAYAAAQPEKAAEFERRIAGVLPPAALSVFPHVKPTDKADATRNWSGKVLNALAPLLPEIIGGSADLAPSNKTELKCSGDYQKATPFGRYLRFGVREHAMAAICNGLAAYGGLIPYCATFLNFISYASGAVRLSALSKFRVLYIMTHDSIGLGEDGPTHQPVETLAALRAMPNMLVFRPADGNEVNGAYQCALSYSGGPSVLALSRQNVPNLETSSAEAVKLGAYPAFESAPGTPADLIIVSTGSEVGIAIAAAKKIAGKSVRVVSMPCAELYDAQPIEYKKSVFPDGTPVLSVEASVSFGWERYSHAHVGVDDFGRSAPYEAVYEYFGITPDGVAAKAAKLLEFYSANPVPPVVRPVFA